jgi:erythromycin esterase-like protein
MQRHAAEHGRRGGQRAAEEAFYAEQNARLAKNAEAYYRAIFRGNVESWNLRDRHMVETLGELVDYLSRSGSLAKIVVWEHNSHIGDARATEMGRWGELNVGQLARERWGDDACLVGFTTYTGTVTAATEWGGPAELKTIRPALAGSYEALFHQTGIDSFLVPLRGREGSRPPAIAEALREPRLERAIGVIYRPQTERASHYFEARLADQFDAVLHFDRTRAVEPLERTPHWRSEEIGEPPQTYPSAA